MDADLYDRLKQTVVRIRCHFMKEVKEERNEGKEERKEGKEKLLEPMVLTSTGVVFDKKGYVLTCAHCVHPTGEVNMEISYFTNEFVTENTEDYIKASVKTIERSFELAILVPVGSCKDAYAAAKLSENTNLRVFQEVYSINHPLDLYYTGLRGNIAHVRRDMKHDEVLRHEVFRNQFFFQIGGLDTEAGSSGGPIFDGHGNLVSVISNSDDESTYAVHPTTVRNFIEEFYRKLREEEEEERNTIKEEEQKRKVQKREDEKKNEQEFKKRKGVCSHPQSPCREQRHFGKHIKIWHMKHWIAMVALFLQLFSLVAHAALTTAGQVNVATGVAGYQDVTCHTNTLQFSGKGVSDSSFGGRADGASTQVLGWPPIPFGGKGSRNGEPGPQFVKVNMDGMPIGRTVDLRAHACYETLAQTIKDMFNYRLTDTSIPTKFIRSNEHGSEGSTLSDGSSEQLLLTYEDKDGDWMLVGDVPWGIFLASVRRLRIRRALESYPYGP